MLDGAICTQLGRTARTDKEVAVEVAFAPNMYVENDLVERGRGLTVGTKNSVGFS